MAKGETRTLQVNVGYLCGLACLHCHHDAGPSRTEVMAPETMDAIVDFASRVRFRTIDVTGGSPELVPHIDDFLARLATCTDRLMFRTNLVALRNEEGARLMRLCRDLRAVLVASLPSPDAALADSQRGSGVWKKSVEVLKELNGLGYGRPGSGLELDLAANPTEASPSSDQERPESEYRRVLGESEVVFSSLFVFANVPLGRFRSRLESAGGLGAYVSDLAGQFNPSAVPKLMCRSLISVSWDGFLYDCDFNLAARLHHGSAKTHVSQMSASPMVGVPIPTGDHCFACAAGAGFT